MKKKTKSNSVDGFTLSAVAAQMNCVRETARRKLHAAGISTASGKLYSLADVIRAFATSTTADERAERIRLLRAKARKTEIENRKSEGELVDRTLLEAAWLEKIVLPLRADMLALKKKIPQCAEAVEQLMAAYFQPIETTEQNEKTK